MSQNLTLYYAPGTCAQAVLIALHVGGLNGRQWRDRLRRCQPGMAGAAVAVFAGRIGLGHRLNQGVPSAAVRAFAQPAGAGAAALGAGVDGFFFGHAKRLPTRQRRQPQAGRKRVRPLPASTRS